MLSLRTRAGQSVLDLHVTYFLRGNSQAIRLKYTHAQHAERRTGPHATRGLGGAKIAPRFFVHICGLCTARNMFFHTCILSSTAAVLAMIAGFVFLLTMMLSPECKCPQGFTESQCNFTNIVCLTQTMFVKGDIQDSISHFPLKHQPGDHETSLSSDDVTKGRFEDLQKMSRSLSSDDVTAGQRFKELQEMLKKSLQSDDVTKGQRFDDLQKTLKKSLSDDDVIVPQGKRMEELPKTSEVPRDGKHSKTFMVSEVKYVKSDHIKISKIHREERPNGLNSHLFMYNLFPVIFIFLAVILTLPSLLWKYESLENDICCILNTLTFAGSDVTDEKAQMRCVEQLVRDLKFFVRCFEDKLRKTVHRMYVLRIILPFVELVTLTSILDANLLTVLNPFTSIHTIYSLGQGKFPQSAMCHFRIVNRSAAKAYTTPCSLPASPLLQLLTPLVMIWLMFLVLHGLYSYIRYTNSMSSTNQNKFYRRNGFNEEMSQSLSPKQIFGNGGFILFTTISKSDSANIMPQVLNNLRTALKHSPVYDDDS